MHCPEATTKKPPRRRSDLLQPKDSKLIKQSTSSIPKRKVAGYIATSYPPRQNSQESFVFELRLHVITNQAEDQANVLPRSEQPRKNCTSGQPDAPSLCTFPHSVFSKPPTDTASSNRSKTCTSCHSRNSCTHSNSSPHTDRTSSTCTRPLLPL